MREGGFAYMPAGLPHSFLNLTGEPGRVILLYTPGGAHRFFEEYGPLARAGFTTAPRCRRSSRATT